MTTERLSLKHAKLGCENSSNLKTPGEDFLIFNPTRQVGGLAVGFSEMTPEKSYVDISSEVSADFFSALWANYFLTVILTLEDDENVNRFMTDLTSWASKYVLLVHELDTEEEREAAVGELPFSNYATLSVQSAKDSATLIDELCFAEVHERKKGSVPFLRKMKLSPTPFKPESALASIIALAKWVHGEQPFFLTELPRFSLEIIERAKLISVNSTKDFRFQSLCATNTYEAVEVAMAKIMEDAEGSADNDYGFSDAHPTKVSSAAGADESLSGQSLGQGTFTGANGNTYTGEWAEGKFHGQGTYTWANGDTYTGECAEGKFHGQGTFTYADGRKYIGERKDNLPWKGIEYDKDGNITVKFKEGVKSELP